MVKEQTSKQTNPGWILADIAKTMILQEKVKACCHTRCMRRKVVAKQQ